MDGSLPNERTFTALFLFAGIGAGALGFLDAQVDVGGRRGRFRSLGGVDFDPVACRSFERLTKSPSLCADLAAMTPDEFVAFAGRAAPDVVFMSPPCKGFSGLMSPKKAATAKYQAMNRLAVAGVKLLVDTWGTDGPGLILLENVPRIATRGAGLLKEIRALLRGVGYVMHEGSHDCGEVGGLAQHRQRFLMVARHPRKVPVFLYQPMPQRVRGCGEVIGELPLPTDPSAGRLHRLPEISLRTWLRLAAIRPGKDWRDLETLDGVSRPNWARNAVAVWSAPTGAVAGRGTNSAWGVADVRVEGEWQAAVFGVVPWWRPFGTITGGNSPTKGAFSVADVRLPELAGRNWYQHVLRVGPWAEPVGTVTSGSRPSGGAPCIADVRVDGARYGMNWKVLDSTRPASTITGTRDVQAGGPSLADLRLRAEANPRCYGVLDPSEPAGTITGNIAPGGSACSIADLRITCAPWRTSGVLGVLAWSQPSYTVTSALDLWAGWAAVADGREGDARVAVFDGVAATGTTKRTVRKRGLRPRGTTHTVGAWFESDPRVPANPALVVRWQQANLDAAPPYIPVIPGRGDGSWHRPLTLLERARLQGLPLTLDGAPLDLEGTLNKISEHVGNAVPVGAAAAIAGEMLKTLVLAAAGTFMLSTGGGVWVDRARCGVYRRLRNGVFPLYEPVVSASKRRPKRAARRAAVIVDNATSAAVMQ